MRHSFHCAPVSGNPHARPLVFTWDPEAGTVDGPDAALVRGMSTSGQVPAHPLPWAWTFSSAPLRSFTDMAAMVGWQWVLPAELVEHYPKLDDPPAPPDDGIPSPSVVHAQEAETPAEERFTVFLKGLQLAASRGGVEVKVSTGPGPVPALGHLATAAYLALERPLIEANGVALLEAIGVLLGSGLPAPSWLAEAFHQRWDRFQRFELASLNEVFDHKPDQPRVLRRKAKQSRLIRIVHTAVIDAVCANPKETISTSFFSAVGSDLGINGTLCSQLYYKAVKEHGLQDASDLRKGIRRLGKHLPK